MPFTKADVEELIAAHAEPAWLREARLGAWQAFEHMPMPDSSKDEDWRRTDISKLNLDAFSPSMAAGSEPVLNTPAELPRGVLFCTLDQALHDQPDLVREALATVAAELDGRKFAALNLALWSGGAFIYVPPNVCLEMPLGASHPGPGTAPVFPRTVIVVDRGASLQFIDRFAGSDQSPKPRPQTEGLSSASTHIVVREGGRLQYVSLQERADQTWHFSVERAVVERDAKLEFVVAALGSCTSKSYVETVLSGPGSEANLVGLVLTDGQQHIDHQTLQEHRAPHTTSNLLLKSAVKGNSHSIFAGLVRMPAEAQQSDAFQEARALLLSENARADAIPKLEIVANDVRCTHAGAIGQVDPEQKFYLMSRGVPEPEALRLIVTGFFEPALERIPVESVREDTRAALARKLELAGMGETLAELPSERG